VDIQIPRLIPEKDDGMSRDVQEEIYIQSHDLVAGLSISHNQFDSLVAEQYYDPQRRTVIVIRKNAKKAIHLNLLDHGGVIAEKSALIMIGIGIASFIQGILLATIGGFILAATGLGSSVIAALKTLRPVIQPIIDNTEQWIEFAQQAGLDMDGLETKLRKEMVSHLLPTRLAKYAALTMLGGGAGSFWLSATCVGLSVMALPDFIHSISAFISGAGLMKHAFEMVREDIITYRFLHHPEAVGLRIRGILEEYKDHQQQYGKNKGEREAEQTVLQKLQSKFLQQEQQNEDVTAEQVEQKRAFTHNFFENVVDSLRQNEQYQQVNLSPDLEDAIIGFATNVIVKQSFRE
jgi:hypothetical protein